ncbi:27937_t:CDS:1, partial [Dentiscutata erythropus]
KAKEFANLFEITGFNASNRWLANFKKRNTISSYQLREESSSVFSEDILKFCIKLQNILQNYEPRNIFNCNEAELY